MELSHVISIVKLAAVARGKVVEWKNGVFPPVF